jgi:hypothetical protein
MSNLGRRFAEAKLSHLRVVFGMPSLTCETKSCSLITSKPSDYLTVYELLTGEYYREQPLEKDCPHVYR